MFFNKLFTVSELSKNTPTSAAARAERFKMLKFDISSSSMVKIVPAGILIPPERLFNLKATSVEPVFKT